MSNCCEVHNVVGVPASMIDVEALFSYIDRIAIKPDNESERYDAALLCRDEYEKEANYPVPVAIEDEGETVVFDFRLRTSTFRDLQATMLHIGQWFKVPVDAYFRITDVENKKTYPRMRFVFWESDL